MQWILFMDWEDMSYFPIAYRSVPKENDLLKHSLLVHGASSEPHSVNIRSRM